MPTQTSDLHVLQTRKFIDEFPTHLEFRRKTLIADGAGGTKVSTEVALIPQYCRVVGQTVGRSRISDSGRQIPIDKAVVGLPNLDVRVGDTFTDGGFEYEVVAVQDKPAWRTTASAVKRG